MAPPHPGRTQHASRMTPVTRKVLTILSDMEWHAVDEVIDKVKSVVPPGIALRTVERSRKTANKHAPAERVKNRGETSMLVASGQRIKARESINSLIKYGRAERKGGDIRSVATFNRVLVVRDGDVITMGQTEGILATLVDSSLIHQMPREELEALHANVTLLPFRMKGRETALSLLNVAITLKKAMPDDCSAG